MSQIEILQNVIQSVEKANGKAAVIFDLDSTLFCVSPRTQAIIHSFCSKSEFLEKFPEETKVLREVELQPTDWGLRSALERHPTPLRQEFFSALRKFWG